MSAITASTMWSETKNKIRILSTKIAKPFGKWCFYFNLFNHPFDFRITQRIHKTKVDLVLHLTAKLDYPISVELLMTASHARISRTHYHYTLHTYERRRSWAMARIVYLVIYFIGLPYKPFRLYNKAIWSNFSLKSSQFLPVHQSHCTVHTGRKKIWTFQEKTSIRCFYLSFCQCRYILNRWRCLCF